MKRRFRRKQLNIKLSLGCGTALSKASGRKLGKEGFSLPELLIVVTLMGILAVLTITGIVLFARDLKLMEMDRTAKQIFVAAQNHLTRMEASGLLAGYEEDAGQPGEAGDAGKVALGTAMSAADDFPADYPHYGYGSASDAWNDQVVGKPEEHAFYRVGHNSGTSSSDNHDHPSKGWFVLGL